MFRRCATFYVSSRGIIIEFRQKRNRKIDQVWIDKWCRRWRVFYWELYSLGFCQLLHFVCFSVLLRLLNCFLFCINWPANLLSSSTWWASGLSSEGISVSSTNCVCVCVFVCMCMSVCVGVCVWGLWVCVSMRMCVCVGVFLRLRAFQLLPASVAWRNLRGNSTAEVHASRKVDNRALSIQYLHLLKIQALCATDTGSPVMINYISRRPKNL